jgi:hypothetical protein
MQWGSTKDNLEAVCPKENASRAEHGSPREMRSVSGEEIPYTFLLSANYAPITCMLQIRTYLIAGKFVANPDGCRRPRHIDGDCPETRHGAEKNQADLRPI